MCNREETIKNTEGECGNREEVHRGNGFAVIVQERFPSPRWSRILGCPLHPARDGSFRNIEAQLQQFSMNARRTPGRVLRNHAEDQISKLCADSFSSRHALMPRKPVQYSRNPARCQRTTVSGV